MRYARLGPLEQVSRLSLGGGGLGQVWGETSPQEARATLFAALDAGVNLIDAAPLYRHCEAVLADAFGGVPPAGVRVTTKCMLGEPAPGAAAAALEASLDASLKAMHLERVDVFLLHCNICEDDEVFAVGAASRRRFATPWSQYASEVVPAFETLKRSGRIGAWGITGVGVPSTILKALALDPAPDVVQAVANILDSPGGIRRYAEPARPRDIIAAAAARGVGVMGIRAVQAGALTAAFDRPVKDSHPEAADHRRAAPFRRFCASRGLNPAIIAHSYALDMAGVDTVVLGVKNRVELAQCLEAEAMTPLSEAIRAELEVLRSQMAAP